MLAFFGRVCYYIQALRRASKYPGVAKFGIALEWGSRGLEFESRHSDQRKALNSKEFSAFSLYKENHRQTVRSWVMIYMVPGNRFADRRFSLQIGDQVGKRFPLFCAELFVGSGIAQRDD